jgi:hypothetical protein
METVTNQMTISSENMTAPVRELARRLSGTDEILLLWHPASDQVELCVRDVETGSAFRVEVASGSAIDAFHHPYFYAAGHEISDRFDRAGTAIVDD